MRSVCGYALFLLVIGCNKPPPVGKDKENDPPTVSGENGARKALERGELVLLGAPDSKWPDWHRKYARLLKQRLGVSFQYYEGKSYDGRGWANYVANERIRVDAWNKVMETEICRRLGDKVLEDLQAEAQKEAKERPP
jgi:hypothetical protein